MFANINFQDTYRQKSKIYLNCDNNTTKQSSNKRIELYKLKRLISFLQRLSLVSLLQRALLVSLFQRILLVSLLQRILLVSLL